MKFHHLEMCAKNGPKIVQFFTQKLDFQLTASRRTEAGGDQWVVSNRSAPIVVTENVEAGRLGRQAKAVAADSVFDVALQVDDVHRLTEEMQSAGVKVLAEPSVETDCDGSVVRSTIHTGFGNIVHTFLDKKSYGGPFLPGFKDATADGQPSMTRQQQPSHQRRTTGASSSSSFTGHVDHVTYACMPGEMDDILHWYKRWFRMDRLIMNEFDDAREGLVIGGSIGIRLKAAKTTRTDVRPFFLVLAEPITINEGNHVNVFLEKHGGPGVEHVALETDDIVKTVTEFRNRGLRFRDAPAHGTSQFADAGTKDDERLRNLGILLDKEGRDRYLYQAFTLPIFKEPTLFLELIQRQGAQAFGAGNITRIMKSIEKR